MVKGGLQWLGIGCLMEWGPKGKDAKELSLTWIEEVCRLA